MNKGSPFVCSCVWPFCKVYFAMALNEGPLGKFGSWKIMSSYGRVNMFSIPFMPENVVSGSKKAVFPAFSWQLSWWNISRNQAFCIFGVSYVVITSALSLFQKEVYIFLLQSKFMTSF